MDCVEDHCRNLDDFELRLEHARWKVLLSEVFRKSFAKIKNLQDKEDLIHLLLMLANGWRKKQRNDDLTDKFQMTRSYRFKDLYLVWSVDVVKRDSYIQVLKVWNLLPLFETSKFLEQLDSIFLMYTDSYMKCCKTKQTERKIEVPFSWNLACEIIHYKKLCRLVSSHNAMDNSNATVREDSKVSESLLLMKFYSLSSGFVKHLLTASDGSEMVIPFELTDEEEVVLRFPCSSFILGRSGTGKTTILVMKLVQKEQLYSISSAGLCYEGYNIIQNVSKSDALTGSSEMLSRKFLKQIFVTVSPKLCSAVRYHVAQFSSSIYSGQFQGATGYDEIFDTNDIQDEFIEIPNTFINLEKRHYPLIITFRKFLMMLDGSMLNSYFDKFNCSKKMCSSQKGKQKHLALHALMKGKEVNFDRFVGCYWPRFSNHLTNKLDPSIVFTEIISHIKGGLVGEGSYCCKLGREEYVMLSERRISSLSKEDREKIFNIFTDYEKKKQLNGKFDLSDLVMDIHRRLQCCGFSGDKMDFVYVDEVQDLSMCQIALFKEICINFKEGFVFAGDTAQTISRGIDFRFEDLKCLFYSDFHFSTPSSESGSLLNMRKLRHKPVMFQMVENLRSHAGVLQLSQSVIDLLYEYFPLHIDKLAREESLICGEAPMLIESGNGENMIVNIFGTSAPCSLTNGFGADQAILVRDESAKQQVIELVGKQALILTIAECKGLEFQDVLLYNFFEASPLKLLWRRAIYGYMEAHKIAHSEQRLPSFDQSSHGHGHGIAHSEHRFPSFDVSRHGILAQS